MRTIKEKNPSNKIVIFILFIILSQVTFSEVQINSLPFVCDTLGETYTLTSNLVSESGSAVTIKNDNIVINGNGYEIVYANSGQGIGILIDTSVSSLEIKDIIISQGSYEPQTGEVAHGISRNGNLSGFNLHDSTININHSGLYASAYGYAVALHNVAIYSTNNVIASNIFNITGTSGARGVSIQVDSTAIWNGLISNNIFQLNGLKSSPAGYSRALSLTGNISADISFNSISLDSASDTIQGVSLWSVNGAKIFNNTLTSSANKGRLILVDGNSDNNQVYDNTIILNPTNSTGASAGIRVRYGSDNNQFYRNNIDASTSTQAIGIRLGGKSATHLAPANNTFYNNTVSSSFRAISLEEESLNNIFVENIFTGGIGGYAIYVFGSGLSHPQDTMFNYDKIIGDVRFNGYVGQLSSKDIIFCQVEELSELDIILGAGIHDFIFTQNECPYLPVSFFVFEDGFEG